MKSFIKLIRIKQWIKNSFVFVPILFSKHLFEYDYFSSVLLGFISFSIVSSIVYIFNDIMDCESDRSHPIKKNRPIASGAVSIKMGLLFAALLIAFDVFLLQYLNVKFATVQSVYFVLNVLYTLKLKNVVILDIMSISTGFMLRVVAGAAVINVEVSSWLILTTLFLSLFLGIMKRRSELTLFDESSNSTRKVLSEYSVSFTDHLASISAAGVIICYALYTVSDRTAAYFNTENLIYTTIFVVFGVFRFMYLTHLKLKGENAAEIMLTDLPMIINVILYVVFSIFIIYNAQVAVF